jgi:hypothetical protein
MRADASLAKLIGQAAADVLQRLVDNVQPHSKRIRAFHSGFGEGEASTLRPAVRAWFDPRQRCTTKNGVRVN